MTTGAPLPDAVGAADRLAAEVTAGVDAALATAAAPPGDVDVGWVAALDAAACPARFRSQGETGWSFPGWTPATAAGAVARSALDHHLHGPASDRPPAPLEAVRDWMRTATSIGARGVAGWVAERRADGDGPALAATAAGAARWIAGFVRTLGWPLPERLALLNVARDDAPVARWSPRRGAPVRVRSGADARIGRIVGAGGHRLVVHRPVAGDDGQLRRRAAFEAAAGALVHRVAAAEVVVTTGDTGERVRVPVDEALLAAGGEMVVEVVRQRVRAVERGHDPADARPSPACRWCEVADGCGPGRDWLARAGRWRGGLPVLAPD
jgi:hypothetical protein